MYLAIFSRATFGTVKPLSLPSISDLVHASIALIDIRARGLSTSSPS